MEVKHNRITTKKVGSVSEAEEMREQALKDYRSVRIWQRGQ